jgi:hypothetical protein
MDLLWYRLTLDPPVRGLCVCREDRPAAGGGDGTNPSRAHPLDLDGPTDVIGDAASDVMERSLTSVREGDEREGGEEAVGTRTATGEIDHRPCLSL